MTRSKLLSPLLAITLAVASFGGVDPASAGDTPPPPPPDRVVASQTTPTPTATGEAPAPGRTGDGPFVAADRTTVGLMIGILSLVSAGALIAVRQRF